MIHIAGREEFTEIHYQGYSFSAVYYVDDQRVPHLIWENVRSCYGSGRWMPERPWLDDDTWKNE